MLLIATVLAAAGGLLGWGVTESASSVTPRGNQEQAFVGRETVLGESALWELTAGTFPRSTANAAIAGRGGITLLDRSHRVYASAGRDQFDALFLPAAAEATGSSFTPRDVAVSVVEEGAGAAFAGSPTTRYRVTASWRLALEAPGRAGSVVTKVQGTILAAPAIARTPFDDVLRLLPVRGALREEFASELAKVPGLPVSVALTFETESHAEALGPPLPPDPAAKVPRTVTRIKRELTDPVRRAARPEDARLFEVPESFHALSLERLAPSEELP